MSTKSGCVRKTKYNTTSLNYHIQGEKTAFRNIQGEKTAFRNQLQNSTGQEQSQCAENQFQPEDLLVSKQKTGKHKAFRLTKMDLPREKRQFYRITKRANLPNYQILLISTTTKIGMC